MRAAIYDSTGQPVGIVDASLKTVQINAFARGGFWRDISDRLDITSASIPPMDQLPPPTPPE